MSGFSYRGKNISEFGDVFYIPDAEERGNYALPFDVSEQEINGRDGAYYYGNRVKPREFALRCYYENLTQQQKMDILHWFGRNTKGRLIFDDRDYVYYDAIPYDKVRVEDYKYNSCDGLKYQGYMTFYLKCYCPFGKLLPGSMTNNVPIVGTAQIDISILYEAVTAADNETVILLSAQMPSTNYVLTDTSFYIYNPGTEPTPLLIRVAGTASEGTITNLANGTTCVVKGMTEGNTTDVGKHIDIDAETGRVELIGATGKQLAFAMHDLGYIWLAPCTPFVRDASISYTNASKTITSDGLFREEMAGQFVYLNGAWRKIDSYTDSNTMTLVNNMDATGTNTTNIVTMNEIVFDGFSLTTLEMEFTPRMW